MPFLQITSGLSGYRYRNPQALEEFSRVNKNVENKKKTLEKNQKLLTEIKASAHREKGCVDQGRLPIPAEKKVVLQIIILGWSSSEAYPTFPRAQKVLRVLPRPNPHVASVKIL